MRNIVVLIALLTTASCARKIEMRSPQVIRSERYYYVRDDDGRLYVVTANTKDFDEAMKTIRPGPASVDKLDLWVITPLGARKKPPQ
jgi:hypothetical protein